MSREEGFTIGDRSTRTLYDVRLVRAYRTAGLAVIVAWDAIVDASWEAGTRVCLADALEVLPYDLGDIEMVRHALASVGLIDEDGHIRDESWTSWFGTASARREAKRERDREYASRRRLGTDSSSSVARPSSSYRTDLSDRTDHTAESPTTRWTRAKSRIAQLPNVSTESGAKS